MLRSIVTVLLLALLGLHAGLADADADFASVRYLLKEERSGRRGDPKQKYFHESVFHAHYDGRFANRVEQYDERNKDLHNLVQAYLSTMADLGAETWLMHGTLLGWWWNRKIMPWDSDIDVQMSYPSLHYLAQYYNMTVYRYRNKDIPDGRDYMLEINPNYINPDKSDKLNVIDARWVDTTSGLFIDITAVRRPKNHPMKGMLTCKDGHEYLESMIYPLRDSEFEGIPVKIPYAYVGILIEEYGRRSLTKTVHSGHKWNPEKNVWELIKMGSVRPSVPKKPATVPNRTKPQRRARRSISLDTDLTPDWL